jgi:hypothetical protein
MKDKLFKIEESLNFFSGVNLLNRKITIQTEDLYKDGKESNQEIQQPNENEFIKEIENENIQANDNYSQQQDEDDEIPQENDNHNLYEDDNNILLENEDGNRDEMDESTVIIQKSLPSVNTEDLYI